MAAALKNSDTSDRRFRGNDNKKWASRRKKQRRYRGAQQA